MTESHQRTNHPLNMRIRPFHIALLYIVSIVLFALLYYFNQDQFKNLSTPFDSIYFSVVTITTLGYGDISPSGPIGKSLVSLQALLGVSALGLLFVSVGQSIAQGSTERHNRASKHNFKIQYKTFREQIRLEIQDFLTDHLFMKLPNDLNFDSREVYNSKSDQDAVVLTFVEHLLDEEQFYKNTILHLSIFEQNFESFIQRVLIEDPKTLEKLSSYRNELHRIQSMAVDTMNFREDIAVDIYDFFLKLDAFKGDNVNDELLNLIDNC